MLRRDQVRAIAFDCYGTLVHVANPRGVHRTIRDLVGGRIVPSPMTVDDETLIDMVRKAAPDAPPSRIEALQEDIRIETQSIRLLPHAIETIKAFQGFDLALASNLTVEYAEPLWKMFGDLIEFHAFSCYIGHAKPDPLFYQNLCGQFGESPDRVLMVGDTFRSDYQGATDAGLHALHIGSPPHEGVHAVPEVGALPDWFSARF